MTDDELRTSLSKNPAFQKASREDRIKMAMEAMQGSSTATTTPDDEFDAEAYLQNAPPPPAEGYEVPEGAPLGSGSTRGDLMATVGGITGAQLGGPLPPARGVGAAIGGGLGYLAGRTSEDLEQGGLPQLTTNFTSHLTEAAKTGLMQGSAEMALPFVGQLGMAVPGVKQGMQKLGGAVAGKVGDWILPKMSPAVEAMNKRIVGQGAEGLTAGQRLDPLRGEEAKWVQLGENIAHSAWFGGPLKHTYQVNEEAAQQAFTKFSDQLSTLSPRDFEGVVKQVLNGNIKQRVMEPARKIYDNLRSRAPGEIIEATPVIRELRNPNSKLGDDVLSKLKLMRNSSNDTADIDKLIGLLQTPAAGTQARFLPKLSLNQSMRLKSAVDGVTDVLVPTDPAFKKKLQAAEAFSRQLESSTESGLLKQQQLLNDPNLVSTYKNAARTYARLSDKYNNQFVQDVLKKVQDRPGTLANLLLPKSGPGAEFAGNPGEWRKRVEAIKQAMGASWDTEAKPLLASSLAQRAWNEPAKRYDGYKLAQELKNYGSENLEALLGPKTGQALMDHARTLEHVAERPKGIGSVAVQLMQASALSGTLGAATGFAITGDVEGALKGGTATILIAPWLLGHLYGNQTWIKAMDKGLLEFQKTGKPPGILLTTLRQAAAVAGKPTLEAALTTEQGPDFIQRTLPNRPAPTTD